MYYCGLVAAFTTLYAGMAFDSGKFGVATACGIISGVNLLSLCIAYFHKEK